MILSSLAFALGCENPRQPPRTISDWGYDARIRGEEISQFLREFGVIPADNTIPVFDHCHSVLTIHGESVPTVGHGLRDRLAPNAVSFAVPANDKGVLNALDCNRFTRPLFPESLPSQVQAPLQIQQPLSLRLGLDLGLHLRELSTSLDFLAVFGGEQGLGYC